MRPCGQICEYVAKIIVKQAKSGEFPASTTSPAASAKDQPKTFPGDPAAAVRVRDETGLTVLSGALLRIGASLDFDTVLREVIECARALAGACYGCITTIDEHGVPEGFVTSGLSEDQRRRLVEWRDGPRLFEHLRSLPGPLRIVDFGGFAHALGVTRDIVPSRTCMSMPMHHLGAHVGNFFLGDKAGGAEFTEADEEILQLVAAQAAAAIDHARAYRAEQRARADLEAVVETSPIGVVVFDVCAGRPVSFNREARRMLEGLRNTCHPGEHLLKGMTCRFAAGRELALDRPPLARALRRAGNLRAEEMTLSTPDRRSITVLVNVTPMRHEDGLIDSVMVTVQDLAPIAALDRTRTEFLEMVSHELRTPLAAIKGLTTTLLGSAQSTAPAEARQFYRIIDEQADRMSALITDLLDAGQIGTGTLSVAAEPTEVGELIEQARATFLSGGGRHAVLIDLPAGLPPVMADRRRIVQVLSNLLANAARHSPDTVPIRLAAERDGPQVAITVADEGRGMTAEQLARLFRKFGDTGAGGRRVRSGLGLAICKGLVEAHGGRIRAESAGPGHGAQFIFTVPLAGEGVDRAGTAQGRRASPQETGEKPRILILEDDPQMLGFVRDALHEADYVPLVAADHRDLRHLLETERPALVLLDLVLSGTDGIELMETVPGLADLPVIFMSGYGRDETIARALKAGAEDYIVKPFSAIEFTARIGAVLRRRAEPGLFVLGELAIDYALRRVTLGDVAVRLTATEYELLRVLSLAAGRVVTYPSLLRQVWAGRTYANAKLVRAYVKRLRRKLGDAAVRPSYIVTERRVGYRMARADDA